MVRPSLPLCFCSAASAALLAFLPLAASCASGAYSVRLEMPRENEAVVRVPGRFPVIEVNNEGPGVLFVAFSAPEGVEAVGEVRRVLQPGEGLERRMARATTVRLWTEGGGSTTVRVQTRDAEGFSLLSGPAPRD